MVNRKVHHTQGRSQEFSKDGAKLHITFSYNFNNLNKFSVHNQIKINGEVEQNYCDIFSIEFVEIKKIVYKYIFSFAWNS